MVSWDHGPALERLAELQPKDYAEVMEADDIKWIKHHLALARMNPATDIVEFSKVLMGEVAPTRVAEFVRKPVAPTYGELKAKYPQPAKKRPSRAAKLLRGCFCAIQDYCDVCQED